MRPPQELLYESESSLRLVDKAIEELGAEAIPDMMDGLGRLAALVERLDVPTACSDEERRELAASFREELKGLSSHLQPMLGHPEE